MTFDNKAFDRWIDQEVDKQNRFNPYWNNIACPRCHRIMADIPEQDIHICQLPKGCGYMIDNIVINLQRRSGLRG